MHKKNPLSFNLYCISLYNVAFSLCLHNTKWGKGSILTAMPSTP